MNQADEGVSWSVLSGTEEHSALGGRAVGAVLGYRGLGGSALGSRGDRRSAMGRGVWSGVLWGVGVVGGGLWGAGCGEEGFGEPGYLGEGFGEPGCLGEGFGEQGRRQQAGKVCGRGLSCCPWSGGRSHRTVAWSRDHL